MNAKLGHKRVKAKRRGHVVRVRGMRPAEPKKLRVKIKLANGRTRVRAWSAAAELVARARIGLFARVAQLAERRLPKPKVAGSTPVSRLALDRGNCSLIPRREWCRGNKG
ncbi:MAG: hypothetical protein QOF76_5281, partial [Solirubrobacteraceae bacterium]|nr:hypothetical protein [Solirubrobacteraceae bacterium]